MQHIAMYGRDSSRPRPHDAHGNAQGYICFADLSRLRSESDCVDEQGDAKQRTPQNP